MHLLIRKATYFLYKGAAGLAIPVLDSSQCFERNRRTGQVVPSYICFVVLVLALLVPFSSKCLAQANPQPSRGQVASNLIRPEYYTAADFFSGKS